MSEPSGSPVIEPGEIVGGKYRIGQMIGRGGMSVVYEAKHVQLGQDVAVKVLTGQQTLSRVLNEAQATARLTSEHVVRVFDVGTTNGGFGYVVMEKLRGCDLSEMLRTQDGSKRPVPVSEAVKLVLEACHGLAEAHAAGIVHRDIKPSNLFLAQKPDKTVTLKVLDFGLARAEVTAATTARGSARGPRIAGSPGYASPEQLGTASDADARADIWGLGVVLYEAVSGHRPFEAATLQDALIAAATLPMPPLTAPNEPIPPGFEDVVRKCLEKDRESRYATVTDLAEALRPFAPPAYAHYVDRVRAVGGRNPFSVGTIKTMAVPEGEGHTATVGTFSTDTFTAEATPDSLGPRSQPMGESPTAGAAPGFLVASVVSQRLVLLLAAIVVVSTCLVVLVVIGTRKPTEASASKPPPSAALTLPPSPSALGPLPPLALPAMSTAAATPPAPEPPAVIDLDQGATPPEKPEKPVTKPTKGRVKAAASAKPAGNPMTYR
jgi:serine/threonine-protein kinase